MTDFQKIYQTQANDYDLLVSREDYQGNLSKALNTICTLTECAVVEFGAGTGRLTRLIAPQVRSIQAFDLSLHMLSVAAKTLRSLGLSNWEIAVADNRYLPIKASVADIAIEGWSFGHFVGWYPEDWQLEIGKALHEMRRVLRPPGIAIILETMGTGHTTPTPPTEGLATFYQWLEDEHGFSFMSIRTDYRFQDLAEAEHLTRFFFGDTLADRVVQENTLILPECTGLWWASF